MTLMTQPSDAALNIQVSGRHVDVGDALRSRVVAELSERVGKYFDRGGAAEVVVSRDGHNFAVNVVMRLATGQQFIAAGQAGDAHAAFHAALAKVETEVRRYKGRLKSHHPHLGGGGRIVDEGAFAELAAPTGDEDED